MKKFFKYYVAVWAILLAVFNIVTFVFAGRDGSLDLEPSFWIGYVTITLAFIGQLVGAYLLARGNDLKKAFYNIVIFRASCIGLAICFVFGLISMMLVPWLGIIVCVIAIAVNAFLVLRASTAVAAVSAVDDKVKEQTEFIKTMTVSANTLAESAKTDDIKEACRKVYEAFRYSDKMSNPKLSDEETAIKAVFDELSKAVREEDAELVKKSSDELLVLISDRNSKCKLYK